MVDEDGRFKIKYNLWNNHYWSII